MIVKNDFVSAVIVNGLFAIYTLSAIIKRLMPEYSLSAVINETAATFLHRSIVGLIFAESFKVSIFKAVNLGWAGFNFKTFYFTKPKNKKYSQPIFPSRPYSQNEKYFLRIYIYTFKYL